MVDRILEVVSQLRRRGRTGYTLAQVHVVAEFLEELTRTSRPRATAEAASGPAPLSLAILLLGGHLTRRRLRGWRSLREGRLVESAGVGGGPEGGEEFGLDDGSFEEKSVVEVHLERDRPSRDQRHADAAPVLVRRILHHRPAL